LEDEEFLQNIIRPVVPKTKEQLMLGDKRDSPLGESEIFDGQNIGLNTGKGSTQKKASNSKPPLGNKSSGVPFGHESPGSQQSAFYNNLSQEAGNRNRPHPSNLPVFNMPSTVSERHGGGRNTKFNPAGRSSSVDPDAKI
jgi:hypothetical protein